MTEENRKDLVFQTDQSNFTSKRLIWYLGAAQTYTKLTFDYELS